jgi:cation transporter-like permease
MMKWMVLASALAVGFSLFYLSRYEELRLHMVIATIAGVGLTVLVGTALMGLVFLSSRTGHDEDVSRGDHDER